jgi:hypothetical protein
VIQNLGLYRVLTRAIERFQTSVRCDPFEEELAVPPRLAGMRDRKGWQHEIVGAEARPRLCLSIDVAHAAERLGIVSSRGGGDKSDRVIGQEPGGEMDRTRRAPSRIPCLVRVTKNAASSTKRDAQRQRRNQIDPLVLIVQETVSEYYACAARDLCRPSRSTVRRSVGHSSRPKWTIASAV